MKAVKNLNKRCSKAPAITTTTTRRSVSTATITTTIIIKKSHPSVFGPWSLETLRQSITIVIVIVSCSSSNTSSKERTRGINVTWFNDMNYVWVSLSIKNHVKRFDGVVNATYNCNNNHNNNIWVPSKPQLTKAKT